MKNNKIIALILCAVLLLSLLTACGGKEDTYEDDDMASDFTDEFMDESTFTDDEDSSAATEVPMGYESGFVMDLPAGYRYDDAWYCYLNDSTGVRISVEDANFFDTENEFQNVLDDHQNELKELDLGDAFSAWMYEDTEGFYGAETHYCVRLSDCYQEKSGCHLIVWHMYGDLPATQTQDIIDSLKTIRLAGEAVGERGAETDGEESEPDVPEVNPYESLVIDFTPAETGAMSTFMSGGYYASDGNSVFGLGHDSNGGVEFVRFDLTQKGSFAEAENCVVLEKGIVATYVTLCGDDVYYIRDDDGIYKLSKDGGTPELVVSDAAAYLQIRGDKLYYCDSSFTFCQAELDGSGISPIFDKEVYFSYFINDEWFIYQDDADDESLHLRHALVGEDITLCPIPTYASVIFGTELFCVTSCNGDFAMAKIDMTYTPDFWDNFSIEYGDRAQSSSFVISPDGYLYYGLEDGLYIDRWREAENPDATCEVLYTYLGEDYQIRWCYGDSDLISEIRITLMSTGGGTSLPHVD